MALQQAPCHVPGRDPPGVPDGRVWSVRAAVTVRVGFRARHRRLRFPLLLCWQRLPGELCVVLCCTRTATPTKGKVAKSATNPHGPANPPPQPHLPTLDIRDGAIDFLYNVYKRVLPTLGDYLTSPGGHVNLEHVDIILAEVGAIEDEVFRRRKSSEDAEKYVVTPPSSGPKTKFNTLKKTRARPHTARKLLV